MSPELVYFGRPVFGLWSLLFEEELDLLDPSSLPSDLWVGCIVKEEDAEFLSLELLAWEPFGSDLEFFVDL